MVICGLFSRCCLLWVVSCQLQILKIEKNWKWDIKSLFGHSYFMTGIIGGNLGSSSSTNSSRCCIFCVFYVNFTPDIFFFFFFWAFLCQQPCDIENSKWEIKSLVGNNYFMTGIISGNLVSPSPPMVDVGVFSCQLDIVFFGIFL